jgi:hypothetical protein
MTNTAPHAKPAFLTKTLPVRAALEHDSPG